MRERLASVRVSDENRAAGSLAKPFTPIANERIYPHEGHVYIYRAGTFRLGASSRYHPDGLLYVIV